MGNAQAKGKFFTLSYSARKTALHAIVNECQRTDQENGSLSWETLFKLLNVQKDSIYLNDEQREDLVTALEHYPETEKSAAAIFELYPQIKK